MPEHVSNLPVADNLVDFTYDIANGEIIEYTRDHRNRLTRATANGPLTTDIHHVYDFCHRLVTCFRACPIASADVLTPTFSTDQSSRRLRPTKAARGRKPTRFASSGRARALRSFGTGRLAPFR